VIRGFVKFDQSGTIPMIVASLGARTALRFFDSQPGPVRCGLIFVRIDKELVEARRGEA
jgi:hypothetical protein